MNWKNVDDCTANSGTAYTASPITVPAASSNYSFPKYQYGHFSGTFNQISAGLWSGNTSMTTAFPTGITLQGTVTSTYATPTAANKSFGTAFTTVVAIGSGLTVSFSTTGPENASPAATLSAEGYTQYLATQLIVASTCSTPGDTPTVTATLQYNEN
jgi:F0F1-type ATP synthase membrane subunit c/vacuolar-type H+-ATPase subunit K